MTKRKGTRRTVKRAVFHRDMYPGVPFCEACFCHHVGTCGTFTPAAAYRCPCTFRKIAGLACVPGAQHPVREQVAA